MRSASCSRYSHARGPRSARSITRQLILMATRSSAGTGPASVRNCQLMPSMRFESTWTKPVSESMTATFICTSVRSVAVGADPVHSLFTPAPAMWASLHIAVEAATHEVLTEGGLEIRPGEYLALARGRPLDLTVKELGLLCALARRGGRVVS